MVLLDGFKELTVCNVLSGFYFISEYGDIISKKADSMLRFKTDKDGYWVVSLCTNELIGEKEHKRKTFRVAGLVLREFGCNPPESMVDPTVDHKDGNRKNNHISNLRWMERIDNTKTRRKTCPGELNHFAKLTNAEVVEIKRLLQDGKLSLRQIGDMYGVHRSTISNIKRKQNWSWIGSTGNY